MTDATLTPEVHGDFGLPLAQLRAAPEKLNIEAGDKIMTRNGRDFRCLFVMDGFAWCERNLSGHGTAYRWTVDGSSLCLGDDCGYRAIALVKGGAA